MVDEAVAKRLGTVVSPVFETLNSVVVADCVDEPMANNVVAVSPLLVWIESFANGDVVPMPIDPLVGNAKPVVVAGSEP